MNTEMMLNSFFTGPGWLCYRESRVLMLGFDDAGKTKILYKWKNVEAEAGGYAPTIGFNCESLLHKDCHMCVWDVGGTEQLRPLWRHYLQNTECLIFVIDATNFEVMLPWSQTHDRALSDAFLYLQIEGSGQIQNVIRSYLDQEPGSLKDQIEHTLGEDELRDVGVLFLLNKQDLKRPKISISEFKEKVIPNIGNRLHTVMECSAATEQGLDGALDLIVKYIRADR